MTVLIGLAVAGMMILAPEIAAGLSVGLGHTARPVPQLPPLPNNQCRVGSIPYYPGYDPVTHVVYVPNQNSGNISVINQTCHLVGTITLPVGASPWAAAFDPANNLMYVSDNSLNKVYAISGLTVKHTISNSLLTDPQFLLWDPGNSEMLVENSFGSFSVVGIQAFSVVGSVRVGSFPVDMCYDPFFNIIVVVNSGSNNVTILNAYSPMSPPLANNAVGASPQECAFDVQDNEVYVTNYADNNVSLLYDGASVGSVNVGSLPRGVVWDQSNLRIYVADSGSGNITEIYGPSGVVKTLTPNDKSPEGMVYDEFNNRVYLASGGNNLMYALP